MNTVSVTPFSQNECVYFPLIASLYPVHFVSASSETVLVSITKLLSFNCVEGSWVAVSPYTFLISHSSWSYALVHLAGHVNSLLIFVPAGHSTHATQTVRSPVGLSLEVPPHV